MLKIWEGYGKNWKHFMYKLDNPFRSIRVPYENSSVTKAFHFVELIRSIDFWCVQNAPFKSTSSIINPFWIHLVFFMHLLIFLSQMTLKLESTTNQLSKGWKLAWYHHFTHIACAKKVERVTAKTGCTSCTKWTISFKVSWFRMKTHLLQRHYIF